MVYADVVVNLPHREVDKSFIYTIPSGLQNQVVIGSRVFIPFAGRQVDGYVVGLRDTTPIEHPKAITGVDVAIPPLSKEALALASWLKDTYLCHLATAIRCLMPSGGTTKSRRRWVIAGNGEPAAVPKGMDRLWYYLASRGAITEEELRKHFPGAQHRVALKTWVMAGWVREENRLAGGIRTKDQAFLYPTEQGSNVIGYLAKAPKQAALWQVVMSSPGISMGEACQVAGTDRRVVRELCKKGLIRMEQSPIWREHPVLTAGEPVHHHLTLGQREACRAIEPALLAREAKTFLLLGVTGSGKTQVYMEMINKVLALSRQALILVPEIALTPQMAARFQDRFPGKVAVLHSGMTAGEKYDTWQRIATGQVAVVVGARSAVFAPFENLGLIILDEEHEPSYKQESAPRYHAREVARWRAEWHQAVVILGSATPSLESFHAAMQGNYHLLSLPHRIAGRPMPVVHVVDLREEIRQGNRSMFSRLLQERVAKCLSNGEQAILFLNRRGFAGFLSCRDCGSAVMCPNCDVSLTPHGGGSVLVCHYCGYRCQPPARCPRCSGQRLRPFGIGTQQVEREISRLYPAARVLRVDRDTMTSGSSHIALWEKFRSGGADVLVGTQMIAKGLDFPGVTLVGVVAADTSLHIPDFRARERTFQLLTQVSGRAGRGQRPGEVVVQTFLPGDYAVQMAKAHDFHGFWRLEGVFREKHGYPPFGHLARFLLVGFHQETVAAGANQIKLALEDTLVENRGTITGVEILGPVPAVHARLQGYYRWQVVLKGPRLPELRLLCRAVLDREKLPSGVRFALEFDPLNMG